MDRKKWWEKQSAESRKMMIALSPWKPVIVLLLMVVKVLHNLGLLYASPASYFLPISVYDCHIVAKVNCSSFLKRTPNLFANADFPFHIAFPIHSNPHPVNLYSEFKCQPFLCSVSWISFPKSLCMLCWTSYLISHSGDYLLKVLQRWKYGKSARARLRIVTDPDILH